MLTLFSRHGRFDMTVFCKGDIKVDYHHTVEDVGITLGKAFKKALNDKKGIVRYGNTVLPMDESLILSAVDISGRGGLYYDVKIRAKKVGDFDVELCEEFWIDSIPVAVSSASVKYIFERFESVKEFEPTVSVVPLMLSSNDSSTATETFSPSVVSNVR